MNAPDPDKSDGLDGSPDRAEAHAALLALVYDELRALASAYLRNERPGHTLQTTALVHEAWLRLSGRDEVKFDSRAHFFRAAALAMRRILLHHAEKKRTLKRGGGAARTRLDFVPAPGTREDVDLLTLNEALERLAMADEQKARVVELRYFGGCTIDETAEALGVSTATVEREWRFARAWLRAELDDGPANPRGPEPRP